MQQIGESFGIRPKASSRGEDLISGRLDRLLNSSPSLKRNRFGWLFASHPVLLYQRRTIRLR